MTFFYLYQIKPYWLSEDIWYYLYNALCSRSPLLPLKCVFVRWMTNELWRIGEGADITRIRVFLHCARVK